MPDKNRYDSDSEKQVTSRRRFLHEGMKVGLKIAAGCFAFIPAANAFAKDVHSDRPNYIPCTTRVCYAYTCMTPCSYSQGGCYCYDARDRSIYCGCGFNIRGQCTQIQC